VTGEPTKIQKEFTKTFKAHFLLETFQNLISLAFATFWYIKNLTLANEHFDKKNITLTYNNKIETVR